MCTVLLRFTPGTRRPLWHRVWPDAKPADPGEGIGRLGGEGQKDCGGVGVVP
jgi:hypothetical protein